FVLVLFFFVPAFFLVLRFRRDRRRVAAAEIGLLPIEGARARLRTARDQRAEDPAERDRAAVVLVFFLEWSVVIIDIRQLLCLRLRAHAARNQEAHDHAGEQDDAEHEAIDEAGRAKY